MLAGWLKKPNWILVCLALVVAAQAVLVFKNYVRPLAWSIRAFGLVSSFERSQIMYLGANEARYVRFLNEVIPADARVVIPGGTSGFSSQSVIQYYLFPRPIHSECGETQDSPGCLQILSEPSSFVLAVGDFPEMQEIPGKVFLPYPDASEQLRGLYVPAGLAGGLHPDPDSYAQTARIPIGTPFIDAALLLAFCLLGSLYVILILKTPSWLEILGLGLPVGMGILSWEIFITSYLGLPISRTSVGLGYGFLLAAAIGLHRILRRSWPRFPKASWRALAARKVPGRDWSSALLWVLLALWLGLAGLVSLGRSYTVYDDIANWGMKGYAMAQQGTIQAGAEWGGHILAYPMNIQLSIAVFWLADGDSLPGSKALFPLLAFSLLLGCYRFWRERSAGSQASLLGLLLIFTTPLFFIHSTFGMANLPFTVYLVLAVLWSVEALERKESGRFLLAGILFAGAAWTRPEGIGFSLLLMGSLLLTGWLMKSGPRWQQALLFLAPLAFPVTWLALLGARNMRMDQIGHTIDSSWVAILARESSIASAWKILAFGWNYITDWRRAGLAILLSILLLLAYLPIRRWFRDRDSLILAATTLTAVILPAFLFFLASFAESDFDAFLSQSFDRAYLPAIVLVIVLTILAIRPANQGATS